MSTEEELSTEKFVVEPTERESKMQSLIESHVEHEAGLGEDPEARITPDFDENVDIGHEDEPELTTTPDLPPGLKKNADGEWVQMLKVDGIDIEQPYHQYQSQAQKYAAGDARLQRSVEFQKELDAESTRLSSWNEQLQEKEGKLADTLSPTLPPADADSDETIDQESAKLVDALFAGNEDDAKKSMADILRGQRVDAPPQVNASEVADEAADLALQRIEQKTAKQNLENHNRALGKAFNEFATDFSDIAGDDALFAIADTESNTIIAEHPEWSPSQVMTEAGNRVRKMVKGEKEVSVDDGERLKHKANLQPIPAVRTSAARSFAKDTEVDTSPGGVIAQMRNTRRGIRNDFT